MIIRGARVIDPVAGTDGIADVEVGADQAVLDGRGLLVVPGLIDLHVHLREPGPSESETIADGARAALRGGFTTVCCMPNTVPALDTAEAIRHVRRRARDAGEAKVLPIGALTQGRRGLELVDFRTMARAGAVAFSDDGATVQDEEVMKRALARAAEAGVVVVDHPLDAELAGDGLMREGDLSRELGLRGIPAEAELRIVDRDLTLLRRYGGRLHLTHLSTSGAIAMVRRAKAEGVPVTCDVTPHHLVMNDRWIVGERVFPWGQAVTGPAPLLGPDPNAKVNPPLGLQVDVEALWAGLLDGTVDAIATDHAPHAKHLKDRGLEQAPVGISGSDTALSVLLEAARAGCIPLTDLVERLTLGPARAFGLDAPGPHRSAVVIDPEAAWRVTEETLVSRGKNTPLLGAELRGKVIAVIRSGPSERRWMDPQVTDRISVQAIA